MPNADGNFTDACPELIPLMSYFRVSWGFFYDIYMFNFRATKIVVGTQLGILSVFNRSSGWGDCVDRIPGLVQISFFITAEFSSDMM